MGVGRFLAAALAAGLVGTTGAVACASEDLPGTEDAAPGPDRGADAPSAGDDVVVLRGDGLGVVDLGAAPGPALDAVTEIMGPPTGDSGWQPAFGVYGTCPGEHVRAVSWDGLTLLFTDGATPLGEGRHLFAWRVADVPPAVAMPSGVGIATTRAEAERAHPGAVQLVPAEAPFPAVLAIEDHGGQIRAYLDAERDVITNLEAGAPCGE